ncbi:hypothetical protein PUMCH_004985 [Australozyma saopauloensis]|uniref:Nudix hydrolase domain-containing protein n=1 Tax=Australozyma saopauloensis TaxID=291208 RepID=A0AAX4HH19_9ASCO|nr:hypothetical protein PUMCH_004985 [[Candida] saopauloensis]
MSNSLSSLLTIIESVDSFPYIENPYYWKFRSHDGALLGYITPEIASRFIDLPHSKYFEVDKLKKEVTIAGALNDFEERNKVFAEIASDWRKSDDLLNKGWRDELYTVYYPRTKPYMLLERAFSCLLGVVTYGVHINGYIPAEKTKDKVLKMWIPRRSPTKATYPGKLDNTIAGGLGYPYGLWENVVKECYEEGGLDADFVTKNITATGAVTYICQPYGPEGHAQPEIEYTYDLVFESEIDNIPHPVDGEAENFTLMTVEEVKQRMINGEFKPNCALVICDFLIRHGIITAENEPNYLEVLSRLHRRFPFATRN